MKSLEHYSALSILHATFSSPGHPQLTATPDYKTSSFRGLQDEISTALSEENLNSRSSDSIKFLPFAEVLGMAALNMIKNGGNGEPDDCLRAAAALVRAILKLYLDCLAPNQQCTGVTTVSESLRWRMLVLCHSILLLPPTLWWKRALRKSSSAGRALEEALHSFSQLILTRVESWAGEVKNSEEGDNALENPGPFASKKIPYLPHLSLPGVAVLLELVLLRLHESGHNTDWALEKIIRHPSLPYLLLRNAFSRGVHASDLGPPPPFFHSFISLAARNLSSKNLCC